MASPVRIAHISDLHCGSRYHIPSLATRVVDELNELEPDVVIVTGDLTDMGFRAEFAPAHRLHRAGSSASAWSSCSATTTRATSATCTSRSSSARAAASSAFDGMRDPRHRLERAGPRHRAHRPRAYRWIEERFAEPGRVQDRRDAPPPRAGAGHRPRAQHRARRRRPAAGARRQRRRPGAVRPQARAERLAARGHAHRQRGHVLHAPAPRHECSPCYNIIEIVEHDRVRVLLQGAVRRRRGRRRLPRSAPALLPVAPDVRATAGRAGERGVA